MTRNKALKLNGPRVVAVAYDNLSVFEFGIVTEVFGLKRPEFGADWYEFAMCSVDGPQITGTGGLSLHINNGVELLDTADVIIIPGWRAPYTSIPATLRDGLWAAHARGARIVGICGGAFVLASAGLLNGKPATTHWQFVETFIGTYPDVRLETAPLFCAANGLYTSAGSAAGIDLCLHIVQEDYGHDVANTVAKRLVVSGVRPGTQPQSAARPILPQDKHRQFPILLDWLKANLATRLSGEEAARKAQMSQRTFLRHFKHVTGMTYGDWMTVQRLARAKTLLRETNLPIDTISEACGYGSSGSFRRAFVNGENISPSGFRKV